MGLRLGQLDLSVFLGMVFKTEELSLDERREISMGQLRWGRQAAFVVVWD